MTDLLDTDVLLNEQLAGMAYPHLVEEIDVCLSSMDFKIPTKRFNRKVCHPCHFCEIDLMLAFAKSKFEN